MHLRCLLALAVLAMSGCAHGLKFLPDDRAAAIDRTERLGRAIFVADALAAQGSDAYLAHGWKPEASAVQGYVVLPQSRTVVFLGEVDGVLKRFASVDLNGAPAVSEEKGGTPSEEEARLFRAIRATQGEARPICPRPYNPIAIADPDHPWTLVYFLASTNDPNEVIALGHVRGIVSNVDGKVLEVAGLSKGCMIQPRAAGPAGSKTVALAVTHPMGPLPTEGHVYSSLSNRLGFYVGANDGSMWAIDDGSIRPLGR